MVGLSKALHPPQQPGCIVSTIGQWNPPPPCNVVIVHNNGTPFRLNQSLLITSGILLLLSHSQLGTNHCKEVDNSSKMTCLLNSSGILLVHLPPSVNEIFRPNISILHMPPSIASLMEFPAVSSITKRSMIIASTCHIGLAQAFENDTVLVL
jgi:hypothetical protein